MADITAIQSLRNAGAAWTKNAGAASQTMVYDRSDENIVLLIENTDAAPCRVKATAAGYGAGGTDLDIDVAAGEFAVVGVFESNRFKDPATQKVTLQILDQDDTAFSGTVTNVLLSQIYLPKSLTD